MKAALEHRKWLRKLVSRDTDLVVRLDDPLWVIVIGNSYPHRDYLKRLGFHWNPNFRQWRFYEPLEVQ